MSLESKFNLSMPAEALRAKYDEERNKRIRADGASQYQELKGRFADLDEDPYIEEAIVRDPIVAEHDVAILGGGFGGLLQGAHLMKQGIEDFVIIERGGDFGGTWYWNRYPGCMCDVESYCYMPLLDDTGYVPSQKYATAPEIFGYCQMIGRQFGLYDRALFQTQVKGAVWDEAAKRWIITTDRGDRIAARHFVIAGGILHKAKLPGVPGIETFKGHAFHTSRWDYDYTGGSPTTFMDELGDKRVGIVGTGATAIQAVPHLAAAAGHLTVFQRTPSAVGPRGNRPTDPDWAGQLQPGWAREREANFTANISRRKPEPDLIDDGWTHIHRRDGAERAECADELGLAAELADFERMEEVRAGIERIVKDKATAEALKPWYGHMCKRPCFHDEYLESFNRPNVSLVDTKGRGVEQINENGVVVDGVEYPLDLLIFSTGFEVTTEYTRRMGFDPVGPGGLTFSQHIDNGLETLHGLVGRKFPNLFTISTLQGGAQPNYVTMAHEDAINIAHILRWAIDKGATTIQPTEQAAEHWAETIAGSLGAFIEYNAKCTPSYFNNELGATDEKGAEKKWMPRNSVFGGPPDEFLDILRQWRASHGEERDMEITTD
jgi:cyclohexanone monooxygenase